MAHRVLQGPHLLGWGPAKAGLTRPVAGSRLAGFLYDANEGSGRRGGEASLLSCTCPCWRVLRERQGPPQTQVALISLLSLTLMAPRALGVWPGFQGGKEGNMRGPGSILKIRLALDWSEKCCAILCLPSLLKGL